MKYITMVVIYMTILCSTSASADANMEVNSQNLVSQYLAALIQGDTGLLLDVIGGDLLESRRTLLQNPDYSSYLAEVYTDASMTVTGSRQLTANSVSVNAVIEKAVDERLGLVFLVKFVKGNEMKLLIVAEQDAERQ